MKLQLCDNDIDRDFERFTPESLKQLAALFAGKTVIVDHDWRAENQTARIYSAEVETVPGRTTVDGLPYQRLVAMAYMLRTSDSAETIAKINGGILKEGSVGCSCAKHTCSICGNEFYSRECPHRPGAAYDGKTCYVMLEDVTDAYEFSFAAVPVQREAGVTKMLKSGRSLSRETKAKLKKARTCRDRAAALEAQAREIEDELVGEWPEDDEPESDPDDSEETKALRAQLKMIIGGDKSD